MTPWLGKGVPLTRGTDVSVCKLKAIMTRSTTQASRSKASLIRVKFMTTGLFSSSYVEEQGTLKVLEYTLLGIWCAIVIRVHQSNFFYNQPSNRNKNLS